MLLYLRSENMKMAGIACITFAVIVFAVNIAHAYTDSEVSDQIDDAFSYEDNPRMARGAFSSAYRMSGPDNDRFARILGEYSIANLGVENGFRSRLAIDKIAQYGTTNSLPFLYSCATNPVCGDCAIKSIIAIEGVTSNSIAAAQSYFNSTNNFPRKKAYERSLLCEKLLQDVYGDDALSQYRPYVMDVALDFAQNVNTMHISLDEALVGADPSYRYSKRRLAVMRAAQMNCINQTLTNYVTNAINELVAYPEAELPD